MGQKDAWEAVAERWAATVRGDAERWTDDALAFFELLPAPGARTLDLGCGEGRVARELVRRGHRVAGADSSATLIGLARRGECGAEYVEADAVAVPFPDDAFDLVVAFMSLQDMDDLDAVVAEAARVLAPSGRFCFAVIHPLWSAGELEPPDRFVLREPYFAERHHLRPVLRVPSIHRPLEAYFAALERAGLVVETVRELTSPHRLDGRLPLYLHVRALPR